MFLSKLVFIMGIVYFWGAGCGPSGPSVVDGGKGGFPDSGPVTVSDGGPEIGPSFEFDDPGATGAFKDPELPDTVPELFGDSPIAENAANLVYPLGNSMHPRRSARDAAQTCAESLHAGATPRS